MANYIFSVAKQEMLRGNTSLNLVTGNVCMCLCNSTYTANVSSDQFFSNATSGLITPAAQVASVSITGGIFKCANVTFPSVASGNGTATQVVLYINSGANTTSPLIAHLDSATGLPVSPNGGDLTIVVDSVNGLFQL